MADKKTLSDGTMNVPAGGRAPQRSGIGRWLSLLRCKGHDAFAGGTYMRRQGRTVTITTASCGGAQCMIWKAPKEKA